MSSPAPPAAVLPSKVSAPGYGNPYGEWVALLAEIEPEADVLGGEVIVEGEVDLREARLDKGETLLLGRTGLLASGGGEP